jgi:hypothetical protein
MSTIAVIGGTGYAGSSIVREAAARGHHVISLSRSLPTDPVDGVTYGKGSAVTANAPENLDWLFVSPAAAFGAFTPQGEPRGTYRTSTDVALFDADGNSAIEVADFALAIVNKIERPTHHRSQIHFAY